MPDLAEELRLIEQARQRLDRAVLGLLDREQHRLDALALPAGRWPGPTLMLDQRATDVAALRDRAARSLRPPAAPRPTTTCGTRWPGCARCPRPRRCERGYAIVQRADGHVVRAAGEVAKGDPLRVRLAAGRAVGDGATDASA